MRYAAFANLFVLALFALFLSAGAHAAPLSGAALAQHLKQGGYVLLMRHASSPAALPDRQSADPGNTALERQLDAKGREFAAAMGQALKSLGIPVGSVLSSPTFRARETVRLAALGTPKTFPELGDGGQSMVKDAVAGQAVWLRNKVSEPPAPATNTIIVTHMPNIAAAFADLATDLSDGEALVFEPHRDGKSDLVARVKIEQWPALASGK